VNYRQRSLEDWHDRLMMASETQIINDSRAPLEVSLARPVTSHTSSYHHPAGTSTDACGLWPASDDAHHDKTRDVWKPHADEITNTFSRSSSALSLTGRSQASVHKPTNPQIPATFIPQKLIMASYQQRKLPSSKNIMVFYITFLLASAFHGVQADPSIDYQALYFKQLDYAVALEKRLVIDKETLELCANEYEREKAAWGEERKFQQTSLSYWWFGLQAQFFRAMKQTSQNVLYYFLTSLLPLFWRLCCHACSLSLLIINILLGRLISGVLHAAHCFSETALLPLSWKVICAWESWSMLCLSVCAVGIVLAICFIAREYWLTLRSMRRNESDKRGHKERSQKKNPKNKQWRRGPSVVEAAQLLGVCVDSTALDIKRAYRKLALKFHPDKYNPRNPPDSMSRDEAAMRMSAINCARDLLMSDKRR